LVALDHDKCCNAAYNDRSRKHAVRKGRGMQISVPSTYSGDLFGRSKEQTIARVASLVLVTVLAVVSPLLASESVNFPSALRQAGAAVQLSGYLYRPDGPGPFPAVAMLHGCSGLVTRSGNIRSHARFWAEHLRDHGYVALLV